MQITCLFGFGKENQQDKGEFREESKKEWAQEKQDLGNFSSHGAQF